MAQELINQGYEVILLNMASNMYPGGGVANGCTAQEEELCRRTDLYLSLIEIKYPLLLVMSIYTPGVTIIKDEKYQLLNKFYEIDVVSVAAIRLPVRGMKVNEDLTRNKIRLIISTALVNYDANRLKKRALVLSAFGC